MKINLSSQFTVNYGSNPTKTVISVKPSQDNAKVALDLLESAIDVLKGKTSTAKGKITSNPSGSYNYSAGAFTVTNLTEEVVEASLKGRITLENLEEVPLELYMKTKRVTELLEEKEALLEILPLQIEELKRVLPIVQAKEVAPIRGYSVAYKEQYLATEAALAAEREAREKLEAELAELRALLEASTKKEKAAK